MVTKTEHKKDTTEWAMSDENQLEVQTDKVRTPGWKLFDFIAHWAIGWGLNIALSLGVVHDQWNFKRNKAIDADEFGTEADRKKLAIGWFHRMTEWVDKYSEKGWAKLLPGKGTKDDKLKDTREQAQEITTGFFTLSGAGHLTTLMSQIMETPKIKRKLVRWLDNNISDPIRKVIGKGPTEYELKERQAIYHKLDNELSGKSAMGMIGSRIFGIATVIGLTTALGAADRAMVKPQEGISPEQDKENRGFGRVPQAFFSATKKFKPDASMLQPAKKGQFTYEGRTYAQYMARMTALEFAGATTTSTTQYLYLMAKEFFGIGVDTNVKKGKMNPTTKQEQPIAVTNTAKSNNSAIKIEQQENKSEQKSSDYIENTKSTRRYAEKTKPVARNYQDKARHSTVEQTTEQSI